MMDVSEIFEGDSLTPRLKGKARVERARDFLEAERQMVLDELIHHCKESVNLIQSVKRSAEFSKREYGDLPHWGSLGANQGNIANRVDVYSGRIHALAEAMRVLDAVLQTKKGDT